MSKQCISDILLGGQIGLAFFFVERNKFQHLSFCLSKNALENFICQAVCKKQQPKRAQKEKMENIDLVSGFLAFSVYVLRVSYRKRISSKQCRKSVPI